MKKNPAIFGDGCFWGRLDRIDGISIHFSREGWFQIERTNSTLMNESKITDTAGCFVGLGSSINHFSLSVYLLSDMEKCRYGKLLSNHYWKLKNKSEKSNEWESLNRHKGILGGETIQGQNLKIAVWVGTDSEQQLKHFDIADNGQAHAPPTVPEVASRLFLKSRRDGAVQTGLAALAWRFHEQHGWEPQQHPQQREPTLHVAAQLGPDDAGVHAEWAHSRTWATNAQHHHRRVHAAPR